MLNFTASASRGVPSENLMPGLSSTTIGLRVGRGGRLRQARRVAAVGVLAHQRVVDPPLGVPDVGVRRRGRDPNVPHRTRRGRTASAARRRRSTPHPRQSIRSTRPSRHRDRARARARPRRLESSVADAPTLRTDVLPCANPPCRSACAGRPPAAQERDPSPVAAAPSPRAVRPRTVTPPSTRAVGVEVARHAWCRRAS